MKWKRFQRLLDDDDFFDTFFCLSVVRLLVYFDPFSWSNSFSFTPLYRRFPVCWMFGVLEHSKVRKNISQQTVHIIDNFLSFSKQYIMFVKVLQYGKLRLQFSVNIRKFGQRCWIAGTELTINKRCSSPTNTS